MDYTLEHVSGPATEPVSLAEFKDHLNITDLDLTTSQNADLESKLRAARREAEGFLGRKIGAQVYDIILDGFPCSAWRLPVEPLISVDGIFYTDEDGTEFEVDSTSYLSSVSRRLVWLKPAEAWPNVALLPFGAVRIRVTVGIQAVAADDASPATMRYPDNIRQAILLRAATLYNIREDQTLGTTLQAAKVGTFEALLSGERLVAP